jgi:hypothetical protein
VGIAASLSLGHIFYRWLQTTSVDTSQLGGRNNRCSQSAWLIEEQ